VDVDSVAGISEVQAAIFMAKVSRMRECSCICKFVSNRPTRGRVEAGAYSRPIDSGKGILYLSTCCINILSRVGVTYKMGFGLDDWIYCTLYIQNLGLKVIQCYRYSIHFTVHHCTRTRVLSLH
jgi:hypothetical protein